MTSTNITLFEQEIERLEKMRLESEKNIAELRNKMESEKKNSCNIPCRLMDAKLSFDEFKDIVLNNTAVPTKFNYELVLLRLLDKYMPIKAIDYLQFLNDKDLAKKNTKTFVSAIIEEKSYDPLYIYVPAPSYGTWCRQFRNDKYTAQEQVALAVTVALLTYYSSGHYQYVDLFPIIWLDTLDNYLLNTAKIDIVIYDHFKRALNLYFLKSSAPLDDNSPDVISKNRFFCRHIFGAIEILDNSIFTQDLFQIIDYLVVDQDLYWQDGKKIFGRIMDELVCKNNFEEARVFAKANSDKKYEFPIKQCWSDFQLYLRWRECLPDKYFVIERDTCLISEDININVFIDFFGKNYQNNDVSSDDLFRLISHAERVGRLDIAKYLMNF
jgi:hypothetical protein